MKTGLCIMMMFLSLCSNAKLFCSFNIAKPNGDDVLVSKIFVATNTFEVNEIALANGIYLDVELAPHPGTRKYGIFRLYSDVSDKLKTQVFADAPVYSKVVKEGQVKGYKLKDGNMAFISCGSEF